MIDEEVVELLRWLGDRGKRVLTREDAAALLRGIADELERFGVEVEKVAGEGVRVEGDKVEK